MGRPKLSRKKHIKIGHYIEKHSRTAERLPCAAGWNPMTSSESEDPRCSYERKIFY